MEDSGAGERRQVPRVFVDRPFSPPDVSGGSTSTTGIDSSAPVDGDFPSSALSDWSSRGETDHSHSTANSWSLAEGEGELSSVGVGPSPRSLLEASGAADESDSSVSPPLPLKLKEGKVREVELTEISSLSDHLTGRQALVSERLEPSLASGKTNAYTSNPFSATAVNPCSTSSVNPNPCSTSSVNPCSTTTTTVNPYPTTTSSTAAAADTLPVSNTPPSSPGLPPRVGADHPRAAAYSSSFSTFLHSPRPYKSSLATPHVLGHDDDDDAGQTRARANSNRTGTERWASSHELKVGVSPSPSPLSHSTEGSTEFLENFIDGF